MTQIEKLAETMSTAIKGWTQKRLEDLRSSVLETVKGMLEANPPKDGVQGPQGIQGERGERGEQGEKGLKGDAGERGETGEKGSDGQPGERGEPGQTGEQGPKGDPGPAGERGEQGLQGERGERGEKGEPGPAGDRGEPGEKGEDGKSVSLEEVRSMLDELVSKHVGEAVTKAVGELPKPQDGKDADQEAIRKSVLAEVMLAFAEIPRPQDGREGPKGDAGKDAVYISPHSTIDLERTYGRGNYASYKGGLWYSFKNTEGMDGWQCMVKGVDAVECLQDPEDPRKIGIGIRMSDGDIVVKEFHVPMVIYQGVYNEARAYKAGDGVTWARHFWIAEKDTMEKPDFGKDWRLVVKGGRDGDKGRDGIDKTLPVKLG